MRHDDGKKLNWHKGDAGLEIREAGKRGNVLRIRGHDSSFLVNSWFLCGRLRGRWQGTATALRMFAHNLIDAKTPVAVVFFREVPQIIEHWNF